MDRPDINGREQIFRIHLAKLKLDKPVEYFSERMAALTPGFAGADIANVTNEAALIAARRDAAAVSLIDFEAAVDRVIGGLEKKNKVRLGLMGLGYGLVGQCCRFARHSWSWIVGLVLFKGLPLTVIGNSRRLLGRVDYWGFVKDFGFADKMCTFSG